jgi:hypothetical protein
MLCNKTKISCIIIPTMLFYILLQNNNWSEITFRFFLKPFVIDSQVMHCLKYIFKWVFQSFKSQEECTCVSKKWIIIVFDKKGGIFIAKSLSHWRFCTKRIPWKLIILVASSQWGEIRKNISRGQKTPEKIQQLKFSCFFRNFFSTE